MGESTRHSCLCTLLRLILRHDLGDGHSVGSDQFVYFDASNAGKKCAPDAFVKLGVPHSMFDSWKVWEHGAPELAVEILSPSGSPEKLSWKENVARYQAIGVRELVAFDVEAEGGVRLRAWDRIENDLVEREITGDKTPCLTLALHWVIVPAVAPSGQALEAALRLARDPEGRDLVPTAAEATEAELRTALEAARGK